MREPVCQFLLTMTGIEGCVATELLHHLGYAAISFPPEIEFPTRGAAVVADDLSNDRVTEAAEGAGIPVVRLRRDRDFQRLRDAYSGVATAAEPSDWLSPYVTALERELESTLQKQIRDQGFPLVKKWYWPDFADAAFVMTHDIDYFGYAGDHLKARPLRRLVYLALERFHRAEYVADLDALRKEEITYGIVPTCFVFPEYPKRLSRESLLRVLWDLQRAGVEIGIHGSWASHDDATILREEIDALERLLRVTVKGVRQHGLRFVLPNTWLHQVEAGLEYDSSFGHNEHAGFRGGMCLPFHPLNLEGRAVLGLLELPLTFMDYTALSQGWSRRQWLDTIHGLCDETEAVNGCTVFNFHQSYFSRWRYPEVVHAFKSLLARASRGNWWCTTAEGCAGWWKFRETQVPRYERSSGSIQSEVPLIVLSPDGTEQRVPAQAISSTSWRPGDSILPLTAPRW